MRLCCHATSSGSAQPTLRSESFTAFGYLPFFTPSYQVLRLTGKMASTSANDRWRTSSADARGAVFCDDVLVFLTTVSILQCAVRMTAARRGASTRQVILHASHHPETCSCAIEPAVPVPLLPPGVTVALEELYRDKWPIRAETAR